jgi:two-component system sensor histidine kinase UhpB
VTSWPSSSLFGRVVLTNGLVFCLGTLLLAFSPATVSRRVLVSEAVVLAVGLGLVVAVNALLLRHSLAPLDRLAREMATVETPEAGRRLAPEGDGSVRELIGAFNAMLDRLDAERTGSHARALAAQEQERRRIAAELHDEIGQTLTAVLLELKRLADGAPAERRADFETVQESVRGAMDEVRAVASRLRPGVLDDLGLLNALAALSPETERMSGVEVRRSVAPGLPEMGPDVELVLYRVAQEALTNVSRHAGAGTVELALGRQGGAVVLRVLDDGRGVRGAAEGSGVTGMRERARLVQGRLDVLPREKGGTEVRLLVPLPTDAR